MNKIVTIIIVIAIAAGAFFGGTYYQKKKTTSDIAKGDFGGNPPQMSGTPPSGSSGQSRGNGGPGGGGSTGEIISKDDKSITIKTSDGSTKIVYFSDSTKINKSESVSSSDLAIGTNVSAMGTTNSDKSVTAQNIMIQNASTTDK